MPVYVDNVNLPFRDMLMSHMTADTLDELHWMAQQIEMKREWFQHPPKASFPHYDVPVIRREKAIVLGVIPISRRATLHYAAKLGIEWVESFEGHERREELLVRYKGALERSQKYAL